MVHLRSRVVGQYNTTSQNTTSPYESSMFADQQGSSSPEEITIEDLPLKLYANFDIGDDVELQDHSFMRVTSRFVEKGKLVIVGAKLVLKTHPGLFMTVDGEHHELVQLSQRQYPYDMPDLENKVPCSMVRRRCKIVYTNQRHQDLSYHDFFHASDTDKPLYFCRFASTNENVEPKHQAMPKTGTIQRIKPHRTDNYVLVGPDGKKYLVGISEKELRALWRGQSHTRLNGSYGNRFGEPYEQQYTFAEDFCGSGGPSLGAQNAGLRLVHAIDNDPAAVETYRHNFSNVKTEEMDVSEYIRRACGRSKYIVDVLHMSPPCQPFASINTHGNPNKQVKNLEAFNAVKEILKLHKPRFVTLEEVRSLTNCNKIKCFEKLVGFFVDRGYSVRWELFNLAEFGVPQLRERFIFIASAPGERLPTLPPKTNPKGVPSFKSINEAIGNIPRDAPNHEAADDRAEGVYWWRDIDGDGPSLTVLTKGSSDEVHHPNGCHYTVRELAAIQGFPDDFEFLGTVKEQCQQIGNDVPPIFAEKLFTRLVAQIRGFDHDELATTTHGSGFDDNNDDTMGGIMACLNTTAGNDVEMTGINSQTQGAPASGCKPQTKKRGRDADDDEDDHGQTKKHQHQQKQFKAATSRPKLRPRPSRRH